MKYVIITAKHHDGFAIYPSDAYQPAPTYPSYDASCPTFDIRRTPFHTAASPRDPIAELRAACQAAGLKFGIYYSQALDWEHPFAPGNDWDNFSAINGFPQRNPGGNNAYGGANWWMDNTYKNFTSVAHSYIEEKSLPQILELITNYQPDIIWCDMHTRIPFYQGVRICKAIREADAALVINGRLAQYGKYQFGDYESTSDRAAYLFPYPNEFWESIPTTNESYAYSSSDHSHKPPSHFIRLLATAASKGGHILMNVGPKGDGTWDAADVSIFTAIGNWMAVNGKSIYDTERTNDIPIPNWGVITKKADTLYLHVHKWPKNGELLVGSLTANVQTAKLLATGETLTVSQDGNDLKIQVPVACPDLNSTVIALTLTGDYTAGTHRLLDEREQNTLLAFDAILIGPSFSIGDGKVNNHYLLNWRQETQAISWNVRVREATEFNLSLAFRKAAASDAGVVTVNIDGVDYDINYTSSNSTANRSTYSIGKISLSAGNHVIKLKGKTRTSGAEYIRPLELTFAIDRMDDLF